MTKIKLCTYNTKNFFDEYDDDRKSEKEIKALAKVITSIAPDVIGFQEVESEASLKQLNSFMKKPYKHLGFLEGNSYRDINCPYVSRFPISLKSHKSVILKDETGKSMKEYKSKSDFNKKKLSPLKFQRDLLLCEVRVTRSKSIAIFNAHFKSRSSREWNLNSSDEIRLAEARMTAKIVENYVKSNPKTPVVIMGDLNQRYRHKSLKPIMSLGFHDPVVTELISKNKKTSTYWKKVGDRIDYILLSPTADQLYQKESVSIYKGAGAKIASDHYPVSIELDL